MTKAVMFVYTVTFTPINMSGWQFGGNTSNLQAEKWKLNVLEYRVGDYF